jgi:hypothetical protein
MNAIAKTGLRTATLGLLSILLIGAPAELARSFTLTPPLATGFQRFNNLTTPPVNLGYAGFFTILSKSGITDVPASGITGNVGTSPITGAADHLVCTEVRGQIVSVDAAGPHPCNVISPSYLTRAVLDMGTAYNDAAGRPPRVTELGAGNIGGLTLGPGVYKWSSGVLIPTNLTLNGNSNSVWIFEIAQNLVVANGAFVRLTGGALAKNVFWQVGGQAVLGTTSHFEGTLLSKTLIAMQTGASIKGRLFAQTAVTLQMNSVQY